MTTGVASGAEGTGLAQELRDGGWRVLIASLVGVALGLSALPFYTLGVFAGPISDDLAWSRADVQSGLLFSMIATVLTAGLTGSAIDRFGARAVAIAGQSGLALGLVLLSLQGSSPALWKGAWFVMAAMAIGSTPLTWSRGIASWFDKGRGSALGIALSGSGVIAVIAPPLVTRLIEVVGWRASYQWLAASVVIIALPCTLFLFRVRPPRAVAAASAAEAEQGLAFGQVLGGYRFWLILAAFAAISFAIGGTIPNLVPMLKEAGVTNAPFYASVLGAMVIVGRVVAGFLLDRFWAPLVAVALLALPSASCLLLAKGAAMGLAAALMGLAGGAEFDLLAFLCARYFGMRSFGRTYAWQWAAFALAAGVGSTAVAAIYDRTGSYAPALYLSATLMMAGGLSLVALGRYPQLPGANGLIAALDMAAQGHT